MTLTEATAKRLSGFLEAKQLTMYRVAKDGGLPESTLQSIMECTTKTPTLSAIYKICRGLKISPIEFLDCELFNSDEIEID